MGEDCLVIRRFYQSLTLGEGGNDQIWLLRSGSSNSRWLHSGGGGVGHDVAINAVRQCAFGHVNFVRRSACADRSRNLALRVRMLRIGIFPFGDQGDDGVSTVGCKLGAVGVSACDVAGNSMAATCIPKNAEVGDLVRRQNHAADPAFTLRRPKAARNENCIKIGALSRCFFVIVSEST